MTQPVIHPSHQRRIAKLHERWSGMRDNQRIAADAMWVGRLARFSDADLLVLESLSLLSQHDKNVLRSVGRIPAWAKVSR